MKYAIISDIHANLTALKNVLADAKAQGVEKIVCLGDVVGYGPLPAETVALARKECFIVLAGNHDDAVSGRGDASTFIDLAKEAVERHRAALSEEDVEWLKSLPYTCTIDKAVAAHGDVFDPPKFYYILDEKGAEANFAKSDARLVFVGHTHEPAIFLTGRSGAVYKTGPQDFTIEEHKRYIVNPGSVGYPREASGKCFSSYVIYDSTERTVVFRYLPFQVSSVMQRGETKRMLGKRLVAAIAAAVALVVAVAVWSLVPPTSPAKKFGMRAAAAAVAAAARLIPEKAAAVAAAARADRSARTSSSPNSRASTASAAAARAVPTEPTRPASTSAAAARAATAS